MLWFKMFNISVGHPAGAAGSMGPRWYGMDWYGKEWYMVWYGALSASVVCAS